MNFEDTENELPNTFVTTIPISTETCDLSTIIEETEYDDDDQTSEYVREVQTMEFRQLDEDQQSGEDDVSDEEIEITFEPGALENKYIEIKETIWLVQSPFTTLEEIPRGRKDGMYFLLDNSSNIEKEKLKEISILGRFWCMEKCAQPFFILSAHKWSTLYNCKTKRFVLYREAC